VRVDSFGEQSEVVGVVVDAGYDESPELAGTVNVPPLTTILVVCA
jgi:hypothetical protein